MKKKFWSVGDINSLVAIWTSADIQQQLHGATSNKKVLQQIQHEMAVRGFYWEPRQLMLKMQKIRDQYNKQKNDTSRGRDYWIKNNPYFEILDSVLSTRTVGQPEAPEDPTASQSSSDLGRPPDSFPLRRREGQERSRKKQFQPDKNSVFKQRAAHTQRPVEGLQQPTKADNTVKPSFLQQHRNFMGQKLRRKRSKQFWSAGETNCLVLIWSTADIQKQLHGATATKKVFQQIRREMADRGFDRELKQIMNKIQKLTKEYNEQKNDTSQSKDYWVQRNPYFKIMDCVLSTRSEGQPKAPEDHTVLQFPIGLEMGMNKQYWTVEETHCLLVIWASSEVQKKLVGTTRTMQVYKGIQRSMAAQGYERTVVQILNKLKKLKRDYWAQKNHSSKGRNYWLRRNPFFEIMDYVLSTRPVAKQQPPEGHTVLESSTNSDLEKSRQMWSVPETNVLLQIWSSIKVQGKQDGPTKSKHIYEQVHHEMTERGFDRELSQVMNKIQKLKKEYNKQKNDTSQSKDYWVQKNPYFKIMDSVLSTRSEGQPKAPEDDTVSQFPTGPEMGMNKQFWSVEETRCLLEIWASPEVQKKVVCPTRNRHIYKGIQRGMVAQGYKRTPVQILNKLKNLKRDYWAQKNDSSKDRDYWLKKNPYFEIMDSVFSTRPVPKQQPPEGHTVLESSTNSDLEKSRQMWSVPETNLLLQIWSSVEVQGKLVGATKSKHIYEQIQAEMSANGYDRSLKQIIYKLINLKRQYKKWISHPSRNNHFRVRKHKHVKVMDLSDKPACQETGVVSSTPVQEETKDNTVLQSSTHSDQSTDNLPAKAKTEDTEDDSLLKICHVQSLATKDNVKTDIFSETPSLAPVETEPSEDNNTLQFFTDPSYELTEAPRSALVKIETTEDDTMLQSSINADLSTTDDVKSELVVSEAQECSSPAPSCSSNSSSPPPRPGKRKREMSPDMLECLERLQERYLQHSREMHEALLNKMDTHMTAMLGLMGRMVAAVEAQNSQKKEQL